jgi:dihydrofolate reductase
LTSTLSSVEWSPSRLIKEIVPAEIEQMKHEPGRDMIIYGSIHLVQALANLGLIDEYQLAVHPVVLGSGKSLFKGVKDKISLKRIQTQTFPSGVVLLSYQPIK